VSTALASDPVNQAERSWYIAGLACAQIEAERIVEGVAFSLLENLLLERSRALSPASFLHQPRRHHRAVQHQLRKVGIAAPTHEQCLSNALCLPAGKRL